MPVLINAFGSPDRMAAALGVEPPRRALGARGEAHRSAHAGLGVRQAPKARHALRRGQGRPQARELRRVPGGRRDRAAVARLPARDPLLAGRRRPLHHAADGVHARSGHRRAQRGHVPPPGLRRPDPRHALADPQGLGRASAPRRGAQEADGGRHRARRRSLRDLLGLRAPAARHRRDGLRGLAARLGRADGAVQDGGRRRARRGRDRAGGLGRSGRATARGALRRSHRLLLAGARLSGLPPEGDHAPEEPDLPDHDRGAARPRRTTGSARPPSASSCRSSA